MTAKSAAPAALWVNILTLVASGVVLFSAMLAFVPAWAQAFFNLLIFGQVPPPASFSAEAIDYIAFIYVVLGAVMIGWSVALLAIIRIPFRNGDRWAWWALSASLGVWFIIDTTLSLAHGYAPNAGLNTVFIIAFAVPLAATYRTSSHTAKEPVPPGLPGSRSPSSGR